jgi:hypothetical protein
VSRVAPPITPLTWLTTNNIPTARVTSWGNAARVPAPITPNLIAPTNVVIQFKTADARVMGQAGALLTDGKPDAPAEPWLPWHNWTGWYNEPHNIELDTFRTQLRVTALTLFEDPAHPESWLRDANLEYWDATQQRWVFIMTLLSDAPVHTHQFPQPVEAARFRIVIPVHWPGNIRLAEIVLHGEAIGPSHTDVIAKRPLAVLFDEGDDLREALSGFGGPWDFRFENAHTGGRCLFVNKDATVAPPYLPPMGHSVPNWDFEIAENPSPGQYRWLQFAWKALSPETKVIRLLLGGRLPHALAAPEFHAGPAERRGDSTLVKLADAPPAEWTVVRYDLWEHFKSPARIQSLTLSAEGGPVAFDQIVLARTAADLPPYRVGH